MYSSLNYILELIFVLPNLSIFMNDRQRIRKIKKIFEAEQIHQPNYRRIMLEEIRKVVYSKELE